VLDLALGVNDEYFAEWNLHFAIAHRICVSVSKPAVEGQHVSGEESHDGFETSNLEHLRLLEDDFTTERPHQAIRTHDHGALRQRQLPVCTLPQAGDVVTGSICLTDCSGRQIQHLVAITLDLLVELNNAGMRPV